MILSKKVSLLAILLGTATVPLWAATAPPATGDLFDAAKPAQEFKSEGANAELADENGAQVLKATFPAGNGYPAFVFPGAGRWLGPVEILRRASRCDE